jgi:phosphoribosylamine--glycine ligase
VKVLLVGSGAREHALAWGIARSPSLGELHAAPGNPGIAALGHCHPVRADDAGGLLDLASTLELDLVVIGPEAPLVAGVADQLRHAGIAVFGPGAQAARIEGSKTFAKDVMRAAGVPTATTLAAARAPCVVKADGLAAGKGVFVCRTEPELDAALRALEAIDETIVVEELLAGREVSLFALCDGQRAVSLGAAQDFKRAFDGDAGPNTGGMGAYAPVTWLTDGDELVERIHQPVLDELARRGSPFVGCLFAGLMVTEEGARVLEFNARFGDPETQVLVPRLEGDLLAALASAARGRADAGAVREGDGAAVTVVLTGPEYPQRSDYSGARIDGVADAERAGALVFHGGTAMHDGALVTNGGRILSVTAVAPSLADARDRAYDAVRTIAFDGARFRADIAAAATAPA